MDKSLYAQLRGKVVERLHLEVVRGEQMILFVENLANHVQATSGQDWPACYIGVINNTGQFVRYKPKVEDRKALPFAMQINLSNPNVEAGDGFSAVVSFYMRWDNDQIKLNCVHTGDNVVFSPDEISNADVLTRASRLLDKPVIDAVESLLRT